MDDLISRKEAINAINEDKIDLTNPNVGAVFKATGDFEKAETQVMTCDRHIEIIKNLQSAHPERIRARWVKQALGWKCSNCTACTNDFGEREFNFCPICGAEIARCKEVRFWDAFPSSQAVLWRDDEEVSE